MKRLLLFLPLISGCLTNAPVGDDLSVGDLLVIMFLIVAVVLGIGFFVGTGWGRSGR